MGFFRQKKISPPRQEPPAAVVSPAPAARPAAPPHVQQVPQPRPDAVALRSTRELLSDDGLWRGLNRFGIPMKDADAVIFGVPTGVSSRGTRAVRMASIGLPPVDSGLDPVGAHILDAGDAASDGGSPFSEASRMAREAIEGERPFIAAGGDSSIFIPIARGADEAFGHSFGIIHLGARLGIADVPDERLSPRSAMLRASELGGVQGLEDIIFVGARRAEREELERIEREDVLVMTARKVRGLGIKDTVRKIRKRCRAYDAILLLVSMNVLDPSFAPEVEDPVPGGIGMIEAEAVISGLIEELPIAGAAIADVGPCREKGALAPAAAESIIFAMIGAMTKKRRMVPSR